MSKIYVTQRENDRHFAQKLPTFRNGFCWIERKITFVSDPDGIYQEGEYGYITANGSKIIVIASGNDFEVL